MLGRKSQYLRTVPIFVPIFAFVALVACKEPAPERRGPPRDAPQRVIEPELELPPVDAGPPPECDPVGKDVCVGDDIMGCAPGGKIGRKVKTCQDGCQLGRCVDTCEVTGVELIYVVDDENRLLSFDPRKLPEDPFRVIGTLDCETDSTPFSMAVDRKGIAWVLYQSGAVYRVSILDAHCAPSGYVDASEALFGMAFVADRKGAPTEQLFVADQRLGVLDTARQRRTPIGAIRAGQTRAEGPELTGTGEGKLFGYFPEPDRGYVVELDRKTGKSLGKKLYLDPFDGPVEAWAFAHWGGAFYIFATTPTGPAVHAVHRTPRRYERIRDMPYRVVGAGVSTCAPALEAPP